MGVVARLGYDFGDLALAVEAELGLGGVEIDGSTALPAFQQHLVKRVQLVQMGQHVGILFAQFRIAVEYRRHLGVGQPRLRTHHALEKARAGDLAFLINVKLAGETKAIDLGIERTQPVGQHLRQHRNDPVGEVRRVAAEVGLVVQRGAGAHVGRYVGDTHQ